MAHEKGYKVVLVKNPDALCDIPYCPYMYSLRVEFEGEPPIYLCKYHFIHEFGEYFFDEIDTREP